MSKWTVRLLGDIDVRINGHPVEGLAGTRAGFLLGYLIAERGDLHGRRELATLLWPEVSERSARANLRQMLLELRYRLGDERSQSRLIATRSGLGFRPAVDDVIDLDTLTAPNCCGEPGSDSACERQRGRLIETVRTYRGPFLGDGMESILEYDARAWLLRRRDQLNRIVQSVLTQLCTCVDAVGSNDEAIGELRRYLDCEPFDEVAHRLLIQALVANGWFETAKRHFESFAAALERHFGHEPAPETRALRDRLDRHEVDVAGPSHLPAERRLVTAVAVRVQPDPGAELESNASSVESARAMARDRMAADRGHVIEAHGGLLLGYYGYPAPLERSAPRAIGAAIQAVNRAGEVARVSAAVHGGAILTGTDSDLPDPIGELSASVSALASSAAPGDVLVSAAVQDRFDCAYPVENGVAVDEPLRAYRIRPSPSPGTIAPTAGPPMVGRTEEYATLLDAWQRVLDGGTETVFIRGEAGSGKTRLASVLVRTFVAEVGTVLTFRAQPHAAERAFGVVVDTLEEWLVEAMAGRGADSGERCGTLAGWLDETIADPDTTLAQLAQLIELPGAPEPMSEPDPERARGGIMEALDHLVLSIAAWPICILLEDTHWFDHALQGWLQRLPGRLAGRSVLILATGRLESANPWLDRSDTARLELQPLDEESASALIDCHTDAEGLDDELRRRILDQSAGVPLFIEEFTRAAVDGPALPPTLQELLLSRLERLGEARFVADIAAVLPEPFTREELEQVAASGAVEASAGIDRFVQSGFLEPVPGSSGTRFRWCHAVYRDAVYTALSASRAERLHGLAADVLIAQGVALPEVVAGQIEAAGRDGEAAHWRRQAGARALIAGATASAAGHFERALAASACVEDASANELEARLGLGTAYLGLHGYGSRSVDAVFRGAMALPGIEREPVRYGRLLWGLWMCASSFHGFGEAWRLARELERLADSSDDPLLTIAARCALAVNGLFAGSLLDAVDNARAAVLDDPVPRHIELAARFGDNPAVTAEAVEGWARWLAGESDAGLSAIDRAVAKADAIGHVPTCAFVHTIAAVVAQRGDDPDRVAREATEVLARVGESHYPLWSAAGRAYLAWADTRRGESDAVERITEVVARVDEVMDGASTVFRLLLADAQWLTGREAAAAMTLDDARFHIDRVGDEGLRADIHLQRARLLVHSGDPRCARDELSRAEALAVPRFNLLVEFEAATLRAALTDAGAGDRATLDRVRERFVHVPTSPYAPLGQV